MDDFLLAQQLLNKTLNSAIVQREKSSGGVLSNPWSSSPNNPSEFLFPTPHCEYLVFLQQHPVSVTQLELDMIERELRFPKGAPLPAAPDMRMSALIFSPDCGFILESQGPPDFTIQEGAHLIGMKLESYIRWGRQGILASAILLFAEIYLLKWQMNSTTTPSAKSRTSFYSVVIMALGDGFACLSFLVSGMLLDATFLPLTAAGFLSFLCVSILGIRFLVDIWTVQAPERLERARRTTAANSVPTPIPTIAPAVITAAGADTLPLPVTAARPINGNSVVILPPDQDLGAAEIDDAAAAEPRAQAGRPTLQSEMGAMYSRFYFLLLAIFFLSLHATSWPTTIRSIYTNILSFTYLSFWVPQIYRNIIRNCRKAVRWEFVLGQSLLRLAPFIYFYTVTDNILYVEPDKIMALILAAWVWIQFWAMESQNILGPRFFVPSGWAPPAYDYHPILHENEQESGTLPIGFHPPTSFGPTFYNFDAARRIPGGRIVHCAICMQDLEVPVVPADVDNAEAKGGLVSTIFSRRTYMVTPCRHIFHEVCLEEWMQYRLQCPICRENLPPL